MKRLRARYGCPVELALDCIGGKWKTVILAWLKQGPMRYGALRTHVPDLSDKVLTERLHELEESGLVERTVDERAIATYRLTSRGQSLQPVLDALYVWGEAAARDMSVSVGRPLQS